MKTQNATEKKLANLVGTCSAAPIVNFKKDRYLESQFYITLKDGRCIRVYSFNRTAAAAVKVIQENSKLVAFGQFIASDVFRMVSFKQING